MIRRRLVYQLAGYDPVDAARHYRRFVRGVPTFARTWSVTVAVSDLVTPSDGAPARWTATTGTSHWRVETTFVPLCWHDIVLGDLMRPMPQRLARYATALFDFLWTGTASRYFRAGWRYGLFFFFPVLHLIMFTAAGLGLGHIIAHAWQLRGIAYAVTVAALGVAVFAVLLQWLGRRWRVDQALEDWIFAWDFLHGRRPDAEARLDRFAQELVEAARGGRYDEIVIVGHSLGATMAVAAVARALDRDPAFGTRGAPVCLLTAGSTIPKFSLHPDAVRVRLDVARVAAAPSVDWAEYHARADPISFYRFDPVTGSQVPRSRFDGKPIIHLVRIRNMLEPQTYRRIQLRFVRVHHQFVMANERRAAYDFYMMNCGPIPIVRAATEPDGPAALIGADGEILDTTPRLPERIAATAGR